jgi:hypothetical protein
MRLVSPIGRSCSGVVQRSDPPVRVEHAVAAVAVALLGAGLVLVLDRYTDDLKY